MRFTYRPGLAFVTCAFVVLSACGRDPIGQQQANSPDASADGRAGTTGTGAAGKAGTTGAAGKPGVGTAGTSPAGIAGSPATGIAGSPATGMAGSPATGIAGTMGAAGNFGIAGTTGAAGTFVPPACTPGATMCAGPSYVYSCLPSGVWSSELTGCALGCFQGVCRQCSPGDSMCNSPTTVQMCPFDGTRWSPPVTCDNGCDNGGCVPHCQPGVGQCLTPQNLRTCRADGIWGATINCQHGCWNDACLACEPSTSMCLTPKTGRRCQDDGTWGTPFTCADACTDNLCTDCQPGTVLCSDEKTVRSCNDNGTWDMPQTCESGICFSDGCRSCKPGGTQCVNGDSIQICSTDGEWGDVITCANTCKAGACTSNPKKVFVTSTTYKGGDLGGLAGADAKCQARAAAAGLTGTFRAWLSDATGAPSTRFKQDGGPYLLVTGSTIANNWTGLTSGTLRHAINVTELGTAPSKASVAECQFPIVWTDTTTDGMLADPGLTCGDWTDSSVFGSSWGTTASQADWTQVCSGAGGSVANGCGAVAPIYCFEQ